MARKYKLLKKEFKPGDLLEVYPNYHIKNNEPYIILSGFSGKSSKIVDIPKNKLTCLKKYCCLFLDVKQSQFTDGNVVEYYLCLVENKVGWLHQSWFEYHL